MAKLSAVLKSDKVLDSKDRLNILQAASEDFLVGLNDAHHYRELEAAMDIYFGDVESYENYLEVMQQVVAECMSYTLHDAIMENGLDFTAIGLKVNYDEAIGIIVWEAFDEVQAKLVINPTIDKLIAKNGVKMFQSLIKIK